MVAIGKEEAPMDLSLTQVAHEVCDTLLQREGALMTEAYKRVMEVDIDNISLLSPKDLAVCEWEFHPTPDGRCLRVLKIDTQPALLIHPWEIWISPGGKMRSGFSYKFLVGLPFMEATNGD
jgi:hypothetical protein